MQADRSAPVVPRWYIGRELRRLREQADYSVAEAADVIRKSRVTMRNIEAGDTSIDYNNLAALLRAFGADEETSEKLLNLSDAARKRGWWTPYAPNVRFAMLLGVESVATGIVSFNHFALPGFLQTAEYAAALFRHTSPDDPSDVIERFAALQPERYAAIFDKPGPDVTVLLDETALRREVAEPTVMVDQLQRVLDAPCTIRVVPARVAHPGIVSMARLDAADIGPVVYVEGVGDGEVLVDDDEEVRRLSNSLRVVGEKALPEPDSRRMVEAQQEQWETLQ